MEIREISESQLWNEWLVSFEDYTFVQSWGWGEVNGVGEKVYRVGVWEGEKLMGMAQGFTISAKRGKILLIPHGPLLKDKRALPAIVDFFRKRGLEEKCVCLRVCPWLPDETNNRQMFSERGFREVKIIIHATNTWLVDLKGTEEEVLARMRKTTRNLINRGVREGVKITKTTEVERVKDLYKLQMEVVKRNNFVPFSQKYMERELVELTKDDRAVLFVGECGEGLVGAALIVFLGKFAYYYQSGSKESKVPVNYVLQWEVIREAKRRGCEIYNMWGVAPEGVKNHPWAGLTMFKMGFGGELKKYMKTQDLVLNNFGYQALRLMEAIPKTWRRKVGEVLKGR